MPAPSRPDIQIFSMVLGYQKRYWWQLSSLLEQVSVGGVPVPKIQCVASVSARDPWFDWNLRILEVFTARGLDVVLDTWAADDERFGMRGQIRTANLQAAAADWVLFNDADMVYSPEFFSALMPIAGQHAGDHRVLASPRFTMPFAQGYEIVDAADYSGPIVNAAAHVAMAKNWPAARGRANGAGFFQLISMPAVRKFAADAGWPELSYVAPTYRRDHNTFKALHLTPSDIEFRRRLGGVVPLAGLKPQYHLNHWRKHDPQYRADRQH